MFRCENRCSVDTEKKGGLVWAGCLPHDPVLSECDRHIYVNFKLLLFYSTLPLKCFELSLISDPGCLLFTLRLYLPKFCTYMLPFPLNR